MFNCSLSCHHPQRVNNTSCQQDGQAYKAAINTHNDRLSTRWVSDERARYAQFFYSIYLLTTHETRTTNHTLPNHYLTAAAAAINMSDDTAAVNEMGKR